MPKKRPLCGKCGSSQVQADATASWNMDTQAWEVAFIGDKGATCEECLGETRLRWIELGEEP